MKSPIVASVGWLLIFSAISFYLYGITDAIILSWCSTAPIPENKYPEAISATISSMQALLLTNLGVLLGISITKSNSAVAKNLMLHIKSESIIADPLTLRETIQLVALCIYIFSLIACLITWIHSNFCTTNVVAVISESGKMFLGVVLAYLTAILNIKNS